MVIVSQAKRTVDFNQPRVIPHSRVSDYESRQPTYNSFAKTPKRSALSCQGSAAPENGLKQNSRFGIFKSVTFWSSAKFVFLQAWHRGIARAFFQLID